MWGPCQVQFHPWLHCHQFYIPCSLSKYFILALTHKVLTFIKGSWVGEREKWPLDSHEIWCGQENGIMCRLWIQKNPIKKVHKSKLCCIIETLMYFIRISISMPLPFAITKACSDAQTIPSRELEKYTEFNSFTFSLKLAWSFDNLSGHYSLKCFALILPPA